MSDEILMADGDDTVTDAFQNGVAALAEKLNVHAFAVMVVQFLPAKPTPLNVLGNDHDPEVDVTQAGFVGVHKQMSAIGTRTAMALLIEEMSEAMGSTAEGLVEPGERTLQ